MDESGSTEYYYNRGALQSYGDKNGKLIPVKINHNKGEAQALTNN